MANIVINGTEYKDVPSIEVPSSDGGVMEFRPAETEKGIVERTITEYINPDIVSVGVYGLGCCTVLTAVDLPSCKTLSNHAFRYCYTLSKARFNQLSTISQFCFDSTNLISLVINSSNVTALNHANAFNNTPIAKGTGYIYVPSALLDSYKTATNWSVYADQFRALEEYTVGGTTTGELDESKI